MTRRETVLVHKREAIKQAAERNRAKSIALVGSVARDEATEDADCDFLVEFERGASIFDMVRLERALGDLLGSKVEVTNAAGHDDDERWTRGKELMLADAIRL